MNKKRPEIPKKLQPGISFEKLVANVQRLMAPDCVVTHNEKILDRAGILRQFDVVFRGTMGGWPVLGVMECKDKGRRTGLDAIEAFALKACNVGATLKIFVSKAGYTHSAIKLAKFESITPISLLPRDLQKPIPRMSIPWYGREWGWSETHLHVISQPESANPEPQHRVLILFQGKPVADWFLRELSTTFGQLNVPGRYLLAVTFDPPQVFMVDGTERSSSLLFLEATRTCKNKIKAMPVTGDGFFDWGAGQPRIAQHGSISFHGFTPDTALWDDHDGPIPEKPGPYQVVMDRFPEFIDSKKEVVDLRAIPGVTVQAEIRPLTPEDISHLGVSLISK